MKITIRHLRNIVRESLVQEIRFDHHFIELLQNSGLNRHMPRDAISLDAYDLAENWLANIEIDTGREIAPGIRSQIVRFVEGRIPGLMLRFRGNEDAARMTMYNLLADRFSNVIK